MNYYVYILASKSRVLYIGITNDLERRITEHKQKTIQGFTSRYNVDRLVHYETFNDVREAIAREKQLKNWHRSWKINLIEKDNPGWKDLGLELDIFDDVSGSIRDAETSSA